MRFERFSAFSSLSFLTTSLFFVYKKLRNLAILETFINVFKFLFDSSKSKILIAKDPQLVVLRYTTVLQFFFVGHHIMIQLVLKYKKYEVDVLNA